MTTAERILEEVRALPETQAREVLNFMRFLKSPRKTGTSTQRDMSAFDRFGAEYDGRFNRDELYDRKVLR
jgi:Ca2+-binding EF-hand superfamily protein